MSNFIIGISDIVINKVIREALFNEKQFDMENNLLIDFIDNYITNTNDKIRHKINNIITSTPQRVKLNMIRDIISNIDKVDIQKALGKVTKQKMVDIVNQIQKKVQQTVIDDDDIPITKIITNKLIFDDGKNNQVTITKDQLTKKYKSLDQLNEYIKDIFERKLLDIVINYDESINTLTDLIKVLNESNKDITIKVDTEDIETISSLTVKFKNSNDTFNHKIKISKSSSFDDFLNKSELMNIPPLNDMFRLYGFDKINQFTFNDITVNGDGNDITVNGDGDEYTEFKYQIYNNITNSINR
jgi:hypothetical protein